MYRIVGKVAEKRFFLGYAFPNEVCRPLSEQFSRMPFGIIGFSVMQNPIPLLGHPIAVGTAQESAKLVKPSIIREPSGI